MLRNAECPVSGRFLLFPAQPCGSAFRPFTTFPLGRHTLDLDQLGGQNRPRPKPP
jgi:hypothetical protein